ncbi:unnamed protein product [Ilex paraguariensis]|uniref:Uncharacterized protein n=1 Tax=Ilex paraguariensis TaxID=185542 RepID=A0ABC8RES0_9AQUA
MATSAFKSTTKRNPIGSTSNSDSSASSNKTHRRSRSLSRFSPRLPEPSADFGDGPVPRGRFVNTSRGSGFPEISLDDLAFEFFPLKDSFRVDETECSERDRSGRRSSKIGRWASDTASSQRRGRSVSRHSSRAGENKRSGTVCNGSGGAGGKVGSEATSRRRSVSVVRYQISDSESDMDHSQSSINHASTKIFSTRNSLMPSFQKPTTSGHRRLVRSLSQKDLSKSHNGYSSHSSALTDDEARDGRSGKNVIEKTIQEVYAQKAQQPTGDNMSNGLYEAMRKELRYAVEEIRTELKQAMVRKSFAVASGDGLQLDNSDVLQAFSTIRKNNATKLEQSEKRKQDVLVKRVLEEQRGRELSKIAREFIPDSKSSAVARKPSRGRKKSNDRNGMSKSLTEEAEKYFEDFISNVEDADISSFDGEKSDTTSSLGGITKPRDAATHCGEVEPYLSPLAGSNSFPIEMDGVILPWLQWGTNNDYSSGKSRSPTPVIPKTLLWDETQDLGSHSTSSHGSWCPGLNGHTMDTGEGSGSKSRDLGSTESSHFDMNAYLQLQTDEDLLFERWKGRQRISSGGLLLCNNLF